MIVEYSRDARKQLKKLPSGKKLKALQQIEKLKLNPLAGKKLTGKFKDFYSLRIWPYRLVYRWFPREKLLSINQIEHRQGAYK